MGASRFSLSKNWCNIPRFLYNKGNGGAFMEKWKKTRGAKIGYSEPPFAIMKMAQATVCDYFQNGCTTNDRLSRNIKTA